MSRGNRAGAILEDGAGLGDIVPKGRYDAVEQNGFLPGAIGCRTFPKPPHLGESRIRKQEGPHGHTMRAGNHLSATVRFRGFCGDAYSQQDQFRDRREAKRREREHLGLGLCPGPGSCWLGRPDYPDQSNSWSQRTPSKRNRSLHPVLQFRSVP